jgi:hypothetical protein
MPMAELKPNHWKALELFEEGTLSLKEIAKACNIGLDSFYDLVEGDTKSVGDIAILFKNEIDKITRRSAAKIQTLLKDNKKLALEKINDYLRTLKASKRKPTVKTAYTVTKILAGLGKATPSVTIGSFSYTKGLQAEDLIHEFKRLSSIARRTLDTGTIPKSPKGKSGRIPRFASEGDQVQEES